MKSRSLLYAILLASLIGDGASAASTAPERGYELRLQRTAGSSLRAALTRHDGAFVYPDIALEPTNCPQGAGAPVRTQAQLWLTGTSGRSTLGELRVPTRNSTSCTLVGKFTFHPDDDEGEMPPTGLPGQGQLLATPIANLIATGQLSIGTASASWNGGQIVVSAADGKLQGSECKFPFGYRTGNVGGTGSSPTLNRLSLQSSNGLLQFEHNLPALEPGTDTQFSASIFLRPGTSTLLLDVDAYDVVEEGEALVEGEPDPNHYSIDISVSGSCR